MYGKNSLANKKRKRIKYDATSGSISGYLLSSSENVEIINLTEDSLDSSEVPVNETKGKGRLSIEFDDSFDLFTSKRASKKSEGISSSDKSSPSSKSSVSKENPSDLSPIKVNFSPNGKLKEDIHSKKVKKASPSKSSNSKSPVGKSKRVNTVKKCDYFDGTSASRVPCPFCFKFEEDIYAHISTSCIRPSFISETATAQLLELHSEYWSKRRTLGIPDFTFNEDEVFKLGGSQGANKIKESSCDSTTINCKIPILKWNSKSKKSKYLLLRQTKTERESKITQKLAILLMGSENNEDNGSSEDVLFQTIDKSVASGLLSALLSQELTFWEKSSVGPDKASDDIYYIKALAPFIAPKSKKILPDSSPVKNKIEEDDAEVASIFASADRSFGEKLPVSKSPGGPTCGQKSETRDSCFTEVGSSEILSTGRKAIDTYLTFQAPFSNKWENIFNSSDLSDSTVLFRDGLFFGHSLVFYTHSVKLFRCLSSSSDESSTKLLDWKDISSVVGKAYIKYIYTGNVSHFKTMNIEDLNSVKFLCEKYDEVSLLSFIHDLIKLNNNEDTYKSFNNINNNTSPDIFEDIDSRDSNCATNTTFTIGVNKESLNSSVFSKRKLDTSNESLNANDSFKKVKTDPIICTNDDLVDDATKDISCAVSNNQVKVTAEEDNDDKAVSSACPVSKHVNDDVISISSADTMSPGRYASLVSRPLSQCSTLPPLSESPKMEPLASPIIFPDSPEDNTLTQMYSVDVRQEQAAEDFEMTQRTPENQRFNNNSFNHNYYMDLQWEDFQGLPTSQSNNDPQYKNSLDRYFDDSLSTILMNTSGGVKGTQDSTNNSIKGSPMNKRTTKSTNNSIQGSPMYEGKRTPQSTIQSMRGSPMKKKTTKSTNNSMQGSPMNEGKRTPRSTIQSMRGSPKNKGTPQSRFMEVSSDYKITRQSISQSLRGSPTCNGTPQSNNRKMQGSPRNKITPQSTSRSIEGSPLYKSTPSRPFTNSPITPSPQIHVSDQVTPMLNYSNLITPEMKVELRKYGLKPDMDRKKAKALLEYIYQSVHPIVPEPSVRTTCEPSVSQPDFPDEPIELEPVFPQLSIPKLIVPESVCPRQSLSRTDLSPRGNFDTLIPRQDYSPTQNFGIRTGGSPKPILLRDTDQSSNSDRESPVSDLDPDEKIFVPIPNPLARTGDDKQPPVIFVEKKVERKYYANSSSVSPVIANDIEPVGNEEEFASESSDDESISSSSLDRDKLRQIVSTFIRSDPILFESILKYVPIWLTKFHHALRESGIRCKKTDLMYTLDELCVIYRTEQKGRSKRTSRKK